MRKKFRRNNHFRSTPVFKPEVVVKEERTSTEFVTSSTADDFERNFTNRSGLIYPQNLHVSSPLNSDTSNASNFVKNSTHKKTSKLSFDLEDVEGFSEDVSADLNANLSIAEITKKRKIVFLLRLITLELELKQSSQASNQSGCSETPNTKDRSCSVSPTTDLQTGFAMIKLKIPVTTFHSSANHPKYVVLPIDASISSFITEAKELFSNFKRCASSDAILFIKNGLVLPPRCTFRHLIEYEATSPVLKNEPLFELKNFSGSFASECSKEYEVVYSPKSVGILVDRLWFERNKRIFPYSNWQNFCPEKHLKKVPKASIRESFYF